MVVFNWLKNRNKVGKIANFYDSYETLGFFGKLLWWVMFVNWIPMALSLALLLASAIAWNFSDDCSTFFWVSLCITGIVYVPWLVSGIVNSIREKVG